MQFCDTYELPFIRCQAVVQKQAASADFGQLRLAVRVSCGKLSGEFPLASQGRDNDNHANEFTSIFQQGPDAMTRKSKVENLVKVKTALAEKYEQMVRTRNSVPRRENLLRKAKRFRDQAANAANSSAS